MTNDEIKVSLDKMLANPKSKTFLNHLFKAYIPTSKISKVWEKPSGEFKCVLTRNPLISVGEVMNGLDSDEYKTSFMLQLKSMLDENPTFENPMKKLLEGKTLGLTGKDTTTFMSFNAFEVFFEWVTAKILSGDKHINWLIKSIRGESEIKKAKTANGEIKPLTKQKKATYALGDTNDVLSKLKAKMEGENAK